MVATTNTEYIWLIDGRNDVSMQTIDKVARLNIDQAVTILFDKRQKEKERSFWLSTEKKTELDRIWDELDASLNAKIDKIKSRLNKAKIKFDFELLASTDYKSAIEQHANNKDNCTLILQLDKPEVRHPIFQMLAHLDVNTLVLTQNEWPKRINILGCVDPLHEHARPEALDDHIVELSKKLGSELQANWTIGHAFFTPPMFLNYRRQFEEIHLEGLLDFGNKHGLKKQNMALLRGLPEHAIPNWIEQNEGNLLVLGIVARNNLVARLIGSTTIALLRNPPADLLLITH